MSTDSFIGTRISKISNLKFIKGQSVNIAEEASKVIVVEFWATWCPPCRNSIPHLTEVQRKFKDQGLIIVGVTNEKDDSNKITDFVNDMADKMDYTVAIDVDETARKGIFVPSGSRGIPTAFILIGNEVVWFGHPMDGSFENEIQKALDKAKA